MKSHLGPYFTHPYIISISKPFSRNNGKYILHTTAQNTFHFAILPQSTLHTVGTTNNWLFTSLTQGKIFIPTCQSLPQSFLWLCIIYIIIDDTRKYHNGRSHTCNSAVNPSCCIEVRTSFRYKINLAKVLSKPRSHTHFGTK